MKKDDYKICHMCKGKGIVDGGAKKAGKEPRKEGRCLYCNGSGFKR